MVTQTDTHAKAIPRTLAQVQPMEMNIQNVSKQYNNDHWGLRDFTLEVVWRPRFAWTQWRR